MVFIKNGDAEIIKIIDDTKQNDKKTSKALETVKQITKNIIEDSNKTESTIESDKL